MNFVNPTDPSAFGELVKKINDGIETTQEDFEKCVDTFTAKQGDLGFWESIRNFFIQAMEKVGEQLEAAGAKLLEFINAITPYLSPGNPFAMFAKQEKWLIVKQKLTASKTTIDGSYLRADTTWKGDVGDRYGDLATRQATAIDTVAGYTDGMMDFLSDYAKSILDNWIEFGETLLKYMADQVDAAFAFMTADPFEWLDVVPKIVALCTNLAGLAIDASAAFARNITDSKDTADQLKQDMGNLYGFPSGKWPTAAIV